MIGPIRPNALPVSHQAGWSVLHPAIAKAIRREARSSWGGDSHALQLAAIDWFASLGAPEEALALALDLADTERVAAIAAAHGQLLVSRGRIEPLVAVGERFSPVELNDPRAIIAVTWALMFGGGAVQARGYLRDARLDRDHARTAALMGDCLDVCGGTYKPRDGSRFHEPPTGDSYLEAVAADLDTLDAIEAGRFDDACERQSTFRSACLDASASGPLTYGEALSALAHLLAGRVDEARFVAARAMESAEAAYGFRAPAAAFAVTYLVEPLFLLGRWDSIVPLVAGRLDVIEQVAFPDGAARTFVTLARVAVMQNRWDEAFEALDRLDLLVRRRGWSVVRPYVLAEQLRIALIQGNDQAAERLQARLDSLVQQESRSGSLSARFWNGAHLRDFSAIRMLWASGNRGGAERAAARLGAARLDWQSRISLAPFLPDNAPNGDVPHPLVRLERLLFHRRPDLTAVAARSGSPLRGDSSRHQACRALGLTVREEETLSPWRRVRPASSSPMSTRSNSIPISAPGFRLS